MAVKLRFNRMGRSHKAFFRLSAVDSRSPRDGRIIESLGFYDPIHKDQGPAGQDRPRAGQILARQRGDPERNGQQLVEEAGRRAQGLRLRKPTTGRQKAVETPKA